MCGAFGPTYLSHFIAQSQPPHPPGHNFCAIVIFLISAVSLGMDYCNAERFFRCRVEALNKAVVVVGDASFFRVAKDTTLDTR